MQDISKLPLIVVRGAGDLATGVAVRLYRAGLTKILLFETENPLAVRRTVAFSEAVYGESATVENIQAVLEKKALNLEKHWQVGHIPLLVDPQAASLQALEADVLVDAILAKKNLGTRKDMAKLVIGLGPGFTAGDDVHVVIETMRGHSLGRVIQRGSALPNTGAPEAVLGYTIERVFWAEEEGIFTTKHNIGDKVKKGDAIGKVVSDYNEQFINAKFDGVIRGLLRNDTPVKKRTKLGDVDPRGEVEFCSLVSDKGLSIGGGVLEAIMPNLLKKI